MERTKQQSDLSVQMKRHISGSVEKDSELEGNFETIISSGSTLLDLAISGKRIRGGGIPGGILLEAFGPSQSGKTALLSEIAGAIERNGGENQFNDPEARLDKEFVRIFGLHIDKKNYYQPDTVSQLFKNAREWKPKKVNLNIVNGIFELTF